MNQLFGLQHRKRNVPKVESKGNHNTIKGTSREFEATFAIKWRNSLT